MTTPKAATRARLRREAWLPRTTASSTAAPRPRFRRTEPKVRHHVCLTPVMNLGLGTGGELVQRQVFDALLLLPGEADGFRSRRVGLLFGVGQIPVSAAKG